MQTFQVLYIFPFLPHGNICKNTCILQFSNSLFKSKLLQCKPRLRTCLSNHLTAQKLPLLEFQKFIDCNWSKKHVAISNVSKMATALKTDFKKHNGELKVTINSYLFSMLRPKLYRLGTIICHLLNIC